MTDETQELGASIVAPLPDRVECCECGHPKQWHAKGGDYCRIALDLDRECPCRCYAPRLTLLLKS